MKYQITTGKRALRLALCATVVGAGLAAQVAHAVVITTPVNIPVPFNIDGVYINVVTGATGTSGAGTSGWDINPYFTGSAGATPGLAFFASTAGDLNRGIIATPLTPGSTLLPSATFGTGVQAIAALPAGTYNFGFRFTNESTPATPINVGYVTLQISPPLAANAVRVLGWAYENSGQSLTVTPVPETSTALMMLGGLVAAGALRKRLQARQAV